MPVHFFPLHDIGCYRLYRVFLCVLTAATARSGLWATVQGLETTSKPVAWWGSWSAKGSDGGGAWSSWQ
jgi:hypothetical protein